MQVMEQIKYTGEQPGVSFLGETFTKGKPKEVTAEFAKIALRKPFFEAAKKAAKKK